MAMGLLASLQALTDALDRNTAAVNAATTQEQALMADLTLLTAVAQQIADDEGALKVSIDAVAAALTGARAAGFTAENQAELTAAVGKLTTAHGKLAADAAEATAAVPPAV